MFSARLTSSAAHDVLAIHDFIAADDPHAAGRFVDELFQAFDRLARFPRTGHARPDLAGSRPVLFWPVGAYLIIYRVVRKVPEIIAVTHGARDIPVLLRHRAPTSQ
jgi:plasmid stabilization system protein ParE